MHSGHVSEKGGGFGVLSSLTSLGATGKGISFRRFAAER